MPINLARSESLKQDWRKWRENRGIPEPNTTDPVEFAKELRRQRNQRYNSGRLRELRILRKLNKQAA